MRNAIEVRDEASKQYPNILIGVRVGDFYEFYREDAALVSEIAERSQDCIHGVNRCGYAVHSIEKLLAALLQNGCKTALIDGDNGHPNDGGLEDFRRESTYNQVAHIDITAAPSYAAWVKAITARCKRQDRERGDTYFQDGMAKAHLDLTNVGSSMSRGTGKEAEHAFNIARELNIKAAVNTGRFKGTDFDPEQLWILRGVASFEFWDKDMTACYAIRNGHEVKPELMRGLKVAGQRELENGSILVRVS